MIRARGRGDTHPTPGSLLLLSYRVQVTHFRVQSVEEDSQKVSPIVKAMLGVLDELRGLEDLTLVFRVLLVGRQRIQSAESLRGQT